jgi:hypothetical protein
MAGRDACPTKPQWRYLFLGSVAVIASLLLALPAFAADIPSVSDADLEAALQLAGGNRAELQAALDAGIQKPYEMQAMRFLVANLPLSDLGRVTGHELIEHFELAQQARGEFAYGQQYDDATWAHFVLPPRMSQEPLSEWRPYLHDQLAPVVKDCATLDEAALKVNAWCGSKVRFAETQRRDQGPLVTLSGGYGRCEELVMLFVCACRSVGVPAREAYCPWWAVSDNNHAWAEVLGADGKWHYTGGCEPAKKLDDAWFSGAVKQAPIICSPCYGIPGDTSGLEVLRMDKTPGARYCLINSTANYRQTGVLDIRPAIDTAGDSEKVLAAQRDGFDIHVEVFNYGAMREIARIHTVGQALISLGAGTYTLTMQDPVTGKPLEAEATVVDNGISQVSLDAAPLGSQLLVHFPPDPPQPAPAPEAAH